jgi:hypothetical protein
MTEQKNTELAKSLDAARAPSANNHVESHKSENGGDTPSAYPAVPSSEQLVGADSGMIKARKRPDD